MNIEEAIKQLKDTNFDPLEDKLNSEAIDIVLKELDNYKNIIEKSKEYIKENSHEFYCKRDELMELEFDENTNATDLIDILEGNY